MSRIHRRERSSIDEGRPPTRINGMFDWVYEEELFLHAGYRWSPDGRSIAYWQMDSSGVPQYPLLDTWRRPLSPRGPGSLSPDRAAELGGTGWCRCRLGRSDAVGRATRRPRQNYIARMDWVPGSSDLIVQRLNRRQNALEVIRADPAKGTLRTLVCDHDEAWVDVQDDLKFFNNGRDFTWTADRDGWRRLERVGTNGDGPPRRLTGGDFDVISVVAVDEKAGQCYFMASPENPTQSYLYRMALDGSGKAGPGHAA